MPIPDMIAREKKLLKDSSIVLFSTSIGSLLLFVANLYLSNLFGHVMFGSFKTVVYLFALMFSVIDLGMLVTLPKYIADKNTGNKIGCLARWFLKIRIFSFALLIIGIIIFKDFIALHFLHDKEMSYLIIAGIVLGVSSFFAVFREMAKGYENFKLYSLSIFATKALSLVIGCSLGYFFGVFYAIIGFGLAGIIGSLLCFGFLIKKQSFVVKEKIDAGKIFFNFSLPVHVMKIPGYLGASIIPLLSLFFSPEIIGYYSFAYMFQFMTAMIPGSIQTVLFPKISRLSSDGNGKSAEKSLKRVFKIYAPVVVFGIIGALIFSKPLISGLFPEYLPGLVIFKVMICAGLLIGYFTIYSLYLTAKGDLKKAAIVMLVQNLLLFLISFGILYWMF